jgi:hypothetical protein
MAARPVDLDLTGLAAGEWTEGQEYAPKNGGLPPACKGKGAIHVRKHEALPGPRRID